ncbi:MAG: hypothetical protein IPH03_17025 [Tetrasphaera sp.]|nr:hypothetical protein [Tetrasphaera sp.]
MSRRPVLGQVEAAQTTLPAAASHWLAIEVDAGDPGRRFALAESTKVVDDGGAVCPLRAPLVAARRRGTQYADLTGEVLFVRRERRQLPRGP